MQILSLDLLMMNPLQVNYVCRLLQQALQIQKNSLQENKKRILYVGSYSIQYNTPYI
jgi:hypothetical protein